MRLGDSKKKNNTFHINFRNESTRKKLSKIRKKRLKKFLLKIFNKTSQNSLNVRSNTKSFSLETCTELIITPTNTHTYILDANKKAFYTFASEARKNFQTSTACIYCFHTVCCCCCCFFFGLYAKHARIKVEKCNLGESEGKTFPLNKSAWIAFGCCCLSFFVWPAI